MIDIIGGIVAVIATVPILAFIVALFLAAHAGHKIEKGWGE